MELIANYTSTSVDPRRFAAAAEEAGFDGVGMSDHLFRTAAYPHVWVAVSAMAQATERVVLTTSFANNLFRSPVEFAQASLTMQWLSGGRFEAGLGAGWLEPEIRAIGFDYPAPRERARRYREAIEIVRHLFRDGRCTFTGEHYTVDVPVIGPVVDSPPPLVASLGGPWTIANIAPLVDRVELKFGQTTRGGDLDVGALANATHDDLARMIDQVRAVAPEVPVGLFTMIAVGDDAETDPIRATLGNGVYGSLVGDASAVLASLRSFESMGISRVQVTERITGSIARLGRVA